MVMLLRDTLFSFHLQQMLRFHIVFIVGRTVVMSYAYFHLQVAQDHFGYSN
jgi:hypothetical protein